MSRPAPSLVPVDALGVVNELVRRRAERWQERGAERTDIRYPLNEMLEVGEGAAEWDYRPLCPAYGADVCYRGTGLVTSRPLPVNGLLWLNLETLVKRRCLLPIRVIHTRQLLPTVHRSGAEFLVEEG